MFANKHWKYGSFLFLESSMFKDCSKSFHDFPLFYNLLDDMAVYAGLLLAPAEGFCLRPRAKKKAYYAVLAN